MTEPPGDYRSMSADKVLDGLYLQLYKPPFWKLRQDLRSVPEVLRIPILIFDFHNEVCVNSILGFLENSTGRYLTDTIRSPPWKPPRRMTRPRSCAPSSGSWRTTV